MIYICHSTNIRFVNDFVRKENHTQQIKEEVRNNK